MSQEGGLAESPLPEGGELVIGSVIRITDYGAYVNLDEYDNIEGLIHISEISSTWVKNIRNHVREKQKVVLKVLRVDSAKRHIDLSLRRVSGDERQSKIIEWKRKKKVESILGAAAEALKQDPNSFTLDLLGKLEEKFGEAYAGLEEMVEKGAEVAERLKIPPEWAEAIGGVAQQKIKIPTVEVRGVLDLICPKPDGISVIKKILLDVKTTKKTRRSKIDVYTLGAPRYSLNVVARNYKDAEKALEEASEYALKEIARRGGEGAFKRVG